MAVQMDSVYKFWTRWIVPTAGAALPAAGQVLVTEPRLARSKNLFALRLDDKFPLLIRQVEFTG